MTSLLLILAGIVLFIIGIVSPHAAGKIERKTDKKAGMLKRMSNWLWDPLTWWAKSTVEFTRKAIKYISELGKKVRRKLPF